MAEAKAKEHKEKRRRAWEQYDAEGDATGFLEEFADDVVYHIGTGPFAGDHKGRDAIARIFDELQEITGGSARAKPQVVLYDDKPEHEYAVALAENRFQADGEHHKILFTHVAHLDGGKIDELWTFSYADPNLPELVDRLRSEGKQPGGG
jgi:uncharacterized protein